MVNGRTAQRYARAVVVSVDKGPMKNRVHLRMVNGRTAQRYAGGGVCGQRTDEK